MRTPLRSLIWISLPSDMENGQVFKSGYQIKDPKGFEKNHLLHERVHKSFKKDTSGDKPDSELEAPRGSGVNLNLTKLTYTSLLG